MHDQDAASLNRMLLSRMEELCQFLLPNGKPKGHHWMVGGLSGEAGESLQITMNGAAAGRFIDFANPENKGASPLWLWAKVKGLTYPEAIKAAKEWLGVRDDDFGIKRQKQKTYAKPEKAGIRLLESNTPVMDYLVVARQLDPLIVAKAKVCETPDGEAICFPFIEKDPETGLDVGVHRKFLRLERPDGKKDSWTTKGTKRCLYGKNLIEDNVSELVICEGEIDALSWNSWGIPAVSIPSGVSDFEWVDVDWDWLSRFEKIYVSMDMDDPGKACSLEIAKKLGIHRCYIVTIPKKDANECLQASLTRGEMLSCLNAAKALELDEIKRPDDFRKDVLEHYATDPALLGYETPWWPELPWRVRKGELTIFSGFSGSGKTQGLNQLMIHLIQQGLKVMDASLEIRPGLTLYYMTRCAMGKKYATKDEAESCINWLGENLYFLDCIGMVSVDRLMNAMEYARKRHGIDVFTIDSLFKCGLNSEDYNAQKQFADRLTTFCNNTGATVFLVAHARKTSNGNEFAIPTKADVAGSSDLTNAAFNVLIWWRNKKKKRDMDIMRQTNNYEELAHVEGQPDGKILLDKQRFGEGEECETFVFFDKDACQFHTEPKKTMPYFKVSN